MIEATPRERPPRTARTGRRSVTLASDETVAAALTSLAELEASPPQDRETLLAVLDISRGYVMRQLTQPARILPAVQPRIDADLAKEMAPLFRKAQELILRWTVGRIGNREMSAESETTNLLTRYKSEGNVSPSSHTNLHASLLMWLKDHRPDVAGSALWREAWTVNQIFSAYKKPWLLYFLEDMNRHDLIGDSVLDVGAGRVAVSDCLRSKRRRIVQADLAAEGTKAQALVVHVDIEDRASRARAFGRMRAYVGNYTVKSVICSHILNYVDFRAVIAALREIHQPGGRLIIFNQPFEGEAELFSPRGVSDNYDLLDFLGEESYDIEYLQSAPWVHVSDYDNDLRAKSLLIVARKSTGLTGAFTKVCSESMATPLGGGRIEPGTTWH